MGVNNMKTSMPLVPFCILFALSASCTAANTVWRTHTCVGNTCYCTGANTCCNVNNTGKAFNCTTSNIPYFLPQSHQSSQYATCPSGGCDDYTCCRKRTCGGIYGGQKYNCTAHGMVVNPFRSAREINENDMPSSIQWKCCQNAPVPTPTPTPTPTSSSSASAQPVVTNKPTTKANSTSAGTLTRASTLQSAILPLLIVPFMASTQM